MVVWQKKMKRALVSLSRITFPKTNSSPAGGSPPENGKVGRKGSFWMERIGYQLPTIKFQGGYGISFFFHYNSISTGIRPPNCPPKKIKLVKYVMKFADSQNYY